MSATTIVPPRRRVGGAPATFFSPAEIEHLLATAKAHSQRDWLLILLTVNHGLRASETITLTPSDIRHGHLWVTRLKGSARTCQPIIGDEREPLLALARATAPGARLFPITRMQFWRIMQATCERAGLDPIAAHPHSLKHSTGRAVLAETGDLPTTQRYLGHSSITSTQEYTKQTDEQAAAAAAPALTWAESHNERRLTA
jgi:integrase